MRGMASQGSTGTKLVSGMAASLPSALAITPLENAKIALQLDQTKKFDNSMTKAVLHLWNRGVLAPYAGLQGVFTRSAISFGPYIAALPYCTQVTLPACKSAFGDTPLGSTLGNLLGGLAAGSLGAFLNCPFDLIRTNLQKQARGRTTSPACGSCAMLGAARRRPTKSCAVPADCPVDLHVPPTPPPDCSLTARVPQAIALAEKPMTTAQIMSLSFSPISYFSVGRQIVAARGFGALYMGLTFKVAHIGGTGACNAALIPYFKKLFGIQRDLF